MPRYNGMYYCHMFGNFKHIKMIYSVGFGYAYQRSFATLIYTLWSPLKVQCELSYLGFCEKWLRSFLMSKADTKMLA